MIKSLMLDAYRILGVVAANVIGLSDLMEMASALTVLVILTERIYSFSRRVRKDREEDLENEPSNED